MMRRFPALFLVIPLLLASCEAPHEDPSRVYRRFAAAGLRGDSSAAWELLGSESRALLSKAAGEVASTLGREGAVDGRRFFLSQGRLLRRKVTGVEIEEAYERRVQLLVFDDRGGRERVMMIREASGWRIDLSRELATPAAVK